MSRSTEPEWASYHFFYQGSGDRLLARLALPAVRDLWDRRQITRFFFVRYGLGGPHIRLRLLCVPGHREEVAGTVRRAAVEFFRRWPSETRLDEDEIRRQNKNFSESDSATAATAYPNNSVVELPFQPEVERYGGPGRIAHSLDFFCVSSACTLRWIAENDSEPRSRRLSHAMRVLLRQALGFAAGGEKLSRLVAYAAAGDGRGKALLIARADQEFARCREDYVGLVREEIESVRDRLGDPLLTAAARVLGWRIWEDAVPVWWRIVGSQLHMTANRMDLMNVEEIYLGQILRRALEDAGLENVAAAPMDRDEDALGELVAASLAQLTPQEVEDER